jgi:chromosome segregation ATPase
MTDQDKEMVPVNFKAPKEAYEQAKEELTFGEMSEELRGRIHEIAFGAQTTRREELRERLESLRSDKREIETEIQKKREERQETERKIERVESKLDNLRDKEGEYNGALEMLESELLDGNRLYSQHDGVKRAAQLGQKSKDEVLADLQERNPEVPSYAFELSSPNQPIDWREVEDKD